jgi:molybdate transport system permease protein
LLGGALTALGISIPFTTLAVVLAQTFVAAPFFVSTVVAGLREVEPRYLELAATLRASPSTTFLRVMLPLSMPSVFAGAGMAWARALGEFGATITFAGNLPGVTRTLPLAVYTALQSDLEAAVSLSVVLLVVSFVVLLGLRGTPGVLPRRARAPRRAG